MTVAVVLASVNGGDGSEAVIRTALAVGRAFAAHVELLHVETPADYAIPFLGEGINQAAVAQMIDAAEQAAKARSETVRDLFEKLCPSEGEAGADDPLVVSSEDTPPAGSFSVTLRRPSGREDAEIGRRGRLADLIVMPRGDQQSEFMTALEAALFDSGHPVLVAPPRWSGEVGRRVAVAWNDTKEAARGVAAALPFLQAAREIVVLTVQKGAGEADPAGVQAYLACHGIQSEAEILERDGKEVADRLLDGARSRSCDLLVMGAYGHSRLREFVLGGATESVLGAAEIPVLMAH